jgi:hypothetical protein
LPTAHRAPKDPPLTAEEPGTHRYDPQIRKSTFDNRQCFFELVQKSLDTLSEQA